MGNLLSRADANQALTEAFGYDPLDRLTSVSLNGSSTLSVGYDAIGNISNKSDLGAYDYISPQTGCSYTGLTAQPHAVRNGGGNAYCYDADGNMVSRSGATVSWYPFNYPLTITQNGGNTSTFYYAPDRSRYRQVSLNGSTSEDRTYVAGLFEKLSSSVEGVVYRHMIQAGDKTVAVRVVSATRNDTYYLHDDHLGSTGVVTDQSGAVQIQESFDAWGKRRGSAWTGAPSAADLAAITKTTHRGFTSQEELDNLSLVDLNGRVYDPAVARFMSADPLVQASFESQSLNRYSYTFDNPLNATDPTGFCTSSHIQEACWDMYPDESFGWGQSQSPNEMNAAASAGANFAANMTARSMDAWSQSAQQSDQTLLHEQEDADKDGSKPSTALAQSPDDATRTTITVQADSPDERLQRKILDDIRSASVGVTLRWYIHEVDAAKALHKSIGPLVQKYRIEIGAVLFRKTDSPASDEVYVGDAVTDFQPDAVDVISGSHPPPGFPSRVDFSGFWHGHPALYSNSDSFSGLTNGSSGDIFSARFKGIGGNAWLSGPSGHLYEWNYYQWSAAGSNLDDIGKFVSRQE